MACICMYSYSYAMSRLCYNTSIYKMRGCRITHESRLLMHTQTSSAFVVTVFKSTNTREHAHMNAVRGIGYAIYCI